MVEFESGRASKWTTAWYLADAQTLGKPVPYKHPMGAVTWVNLDPGVEAAILAQMAYQPFEIVVPAASSKHDSFAGAMTCEKFSVDPRILVPVAKDGSWFGPHLLRAGEFTIGEKRDERRVETFGQALQRLKEMEVARWRRPNSKGNWGIVSGVQWLPAGEVR